MASGRLFGLHRLATGLSTGATSRVRHAQTCLVPMRPDSTFTGRPLDDPNSNVKVGVTSDGKTIVCYHPNVDVPYEFTQPIERPDPLTNQSETHDQVLKAHLSKEVLKDKGGPTREELSKMFFTTKHRWYPVGQYHTRRKKKGPKDRE